MALLQVYTQINLMLVIGSAHPGGLVSRKIGQQQLTGDTSNIERCVFPQLQRFFLTLLLKNRVIKLN